MHLPKPIEGVFPKTCSNCSKVFNDIYIFYAETLALHKEGSIIGRGKILLPRNCKCGTTLTIQIEERRDLSESGELKRKWIAKEIKRINESISTDYYSAKKLALENFKKIT